MNADTLHRIADRVRRLMPHHADPERFHVEKDEVERELRKLARSLQHDRAR